MQAQSKLRDVMPALLTSPRLSLTAVELQLLTAFRAINDRQQQNMARGMASAAKTFPRRTAPTFKLIVGGAA
jgi:hypothetical protein